MQKSTNSVLPLLACLFIIGICLSYCLPAQDTIKVPLADVLRKHLDANDEDAYIKTVIRTLSQNNRFTAEEFDLDMNYGDYGFYLGLCNFRTGEYGYSAASFLIAIKGIRQNCPQMIGYGYLALGNASFMASFDRPQVLGEGIKNYQNAANEKLSGGFGGLAIIYSMNNNRNDALANLNKMLDIDKSSQSLSIALFCSLVMNDKKLFLSYIRIIDNKTMKETPFVMNNIAAGLEQFDLGKRETGHSKDELMENFSQIEQQQKKYGIVEYRMDSKKIYLESSRKERIVIPKIDIEYSIGWGPQKRGEPVNTKNENNKD